MPIFDFDGKRPAAGPVHILQIAQGLTQRRCMSAHRTDIHRLQEIVRLHQLGRGSRSIARELKISTNTERRYRTIFAEAGLLSGDPDALPELAELRAAVDADLAANAKLNTKSVSSIASWRPELERLYKGGATPEAIGGRLTDRRLGGDPRGPSERSSSWRRARDASHQDSTTQCFLRPPARTCEIVSC